MPGRFGSASFTDPAILACFWLSLLPGDLPARARIAAFDREALGFLRNADVQPQSAISMQTWEPIVRGSNGISRAAAGSIPPRVA